MDLPGGTCHVWWAPRSAASERLTAVLSPAERERRLRFVREEDRDRYLVAHALTRIVLGAVSGTPPEELAFDVTCARCGGPHGKPRLPEGGLEFSISHSGDRIALAVAPGTPVGVDVERLIESRDLDGLAAAVLADGEGLGPDGTDRAAALTTYWTRKEAVLKTTGDGLSVAPRTLTVSAPGRPPALLSWPDGPHVHLYDLRPGPGHLACLGSLAPVRVVEKDGTELLARAAVPQEDQAS
ncbi:4'-phosphopantetheinyl transferase superfamily protein [Actinoallomurus purpureus]|uniref:4'-phosphopantetheinyl transferase family protein n=1 Tax=Actinoallomurus purpureus TaxID=478114 RepID=UPI002092870E|nr:4'-phosphopantetheinyl transferase superfamily protein [Actinoallomurus purpureus]MCO6010647.1 4'-phosphopantetheinyl transferase superfamily protein [Actinoallomurus purpureus]